MIKYFIVYEFELKCDVGKTSAVIDTPVSIKTMDDIIALQNLIKEQNPNYESVLITNIVRLED